MKKELRFTQAFPNSTTEFIPNLRKLICKFPLWKNLKKEYLLQIQTEKEVKRFSLVVSLL